MFPSKLRLYLDRLTRSIWFLPVAYAIGALLSLLAASLLAPLVPQGLPRLVGSDATAGVLRILASSLLAVAIFAIGSLVSALNATATSATPRARRLITADRVAQNTIAVFIGTFIFAILALIGISTGYYEGPAQVILLGFTLLVIAVVISNLISWIDQISRLGGVEEAINMVARATEASFRAEAKEPMLGGRALMRVPADAAPVHLEQIGFVQLVDGAALDRAAEQAGCELYVLVRPGDHVSPDWPVVQASAALDPETLGLVRAAFVVGDRRSFEADPRFGLNCLSEIASRALSPGINDPGTAIDVLSTELRVIAGWRSGEPAEEDGDPPSRPRLHVAPISPGACLEAAFRRIGRDGAGILEVQTQLQTALGVLASHDPATFAAPARGLSNEAMERAAEALTEREASELRRAADAAFAQSGRPPA